jgi:RHS repeat-associated protein
VYPNGVTTTYQYFNNDLLKRITDANTSTTLFDHQYAYNTARQISQIVEPVRTRTLGYDNIDRLTSVTDPTNGNEAYSFDDVGNRLSSHLAASYGYQSGQLNRLTSATTSTQTVSYTHDANGNTTTKSEGSSFWRYTWDQENRLAEAATRKDRVRYKFDALGRRVQRIAGNGRENTKFVHDGDDVLVDDDAGILTKYVNGDGIDTKLRVQDSSGAKYFLSDHLGSTNGLVDGSGAVTSQTAYDSFGNSTNATFPTRYQFTGREYDSFSGFHYYRARFFDPRLGRFASEDPIGLDGGINF